MYKPPCAYACRDMISGAMLDCPESTEDHHAGMDMDGMSMKKRHGHEDPATPACRSQNLPWLTTLAYCISQKCSTVENSKLEWFWENKASDGDSDEPIVPHWTYGETLMFVNGTPTALYDSEEVLNSTVLVDEESYMADYLTIDDFARGEAIHARLA